MSVIEISNLTKYYGESRGIIDVTLNVNEGEIIGFIGPNGAGKSTTIRTLLALLNKDSGEAKIFGKEVKKFPKILEDVGYLPSEVAYYDNMKVIDLLKYSASFYKKDCTKKMLELAKILELDLYKKIEDLSYGNKKKVGIVQGLMHEPKLLILDEPTGGLDPLMQQTFFNILREENKKGTTIFFSSHILSEVEKICNRVAIIKEGKLVTIEKIQTLKERNHRRITLDLQKEIAMEKLNITGVLDLKRNENSYSFLYSGDINIIIALISTLPLINITIHEPELEEIFHHFYQTEE